LASTPTPPRSPGQDSYQNSSPFRIRKKGTSLLWQTQPDVDLQRLALFQRQPKNLSPADPNGPTYLPPQMPSKAEKPLLVLDLDETLVHASFAPGKPYNLKITISVDGETGDIFVAYRPHMMTFLKVVASLFEVAIFTASQRCYAEQLMDHIDPNGTIVGKNRLYREHCTNVSGANVKDLSRIGRPLGRVAIIDNSPVAYLFQPRNAIPIASWFDDPNDTELLKLIPLLRQLASVNEVYDVLDVHNCTKQSPPNSPSKLSRG
jgi:RNA polymerase II subunit A small phosphatase-like protein